MKPQSLLLPIAVALLAQGCAIFDSRPGSPGIDAAALAPLHAGDGYYAVIDAVEPVAIGDLRDVYLIRVRFDDGSSRTVRQGGLDGMQIGDSVRIESDRVRRY